MEIIDILIFLVVALFVGWLLYRLFRAYGRSNDNEIAANAPPPLHTAPGEPIGEINAKTRYWNMAFNAYDIFRSIRESDSLVPVLTDEQRKEVDDYIREFKQHT